MKHTKSVFLFVAATAFFVSGSFAQTTSGKFVIAKGQKFQVDNVVKSTTTLEMMGQPMEIVADANSMYLVDVKDKNATTASVNSTLTKIKMNSNIMGQAIDFDSDKKEDLESEQGKTITKQLNVPKEMELDNQAKVVSVKKSTDSVAADADDMAAMMSSLSGGSKDETPGVTEAFMVLPAGKKLGDTWQDSTIAEGLKTYKTYTIKELKGNDAVVTLVGSQSTNKKIERQGMEVTVTMESKLSGEVTVDVTTGIVKQKTMTVDGTGSADMMGQAVPMTTKVVSTISIKNL